MGMPQQSAFCVQFQVLAENYKESQSVNWYSHYMECGDVDFVIPCGQLVKGLFPKPFSEGRYAPASTSSNAADTVINILF